MKEQRAPLISFIVPVYNGEEYICRCLDSLVRQGPYDFEVLIINDGSTDKTGEMLKSYAAKDKRFRTYFQNNRGYVDTMNSLISLANGRYIYSVDADNWVPDGLIKNAFKLLASGELDFVQYSLIVSGSNKVMPDNKLSNWKVLNLGSKEEIYHAICNNEVYLASHGGKFIKTSLAKKFLFHGEPTGSDRRWLGQILAVSTSAALASSIGLLVEMRKESISKKIWMPMDHIFYSFEMLKDISFYQTIDGVNGLRFYPQLAVCFDHYYRGIWGLISDGTSLNNLVMNVGKTIWYSRGIIFRQEVLVKKRLSIWLICKHPKLYELLGKLKICIAHFRKK